MAHMLRVAEAQARILELARPLDACELPLLQLLNLYIAQDLYARRTQPSHDLSAMDGYAIGASEGPWSLIGESRAGAPYDGVLHAGESVRISTGAHMPEGADRVLIQENAQIEGGAVSAACDAPEARRHVRCKGFDFAAGDLLIASGTRLTPAHIALAASAGHRAARTARAPSIAILDSGDELVADPQAAKPHQIPASNALMLAAMFAPLSCEILRLGPVRDDRSALAEALEKAEAADILITTGGASVGDHDLMQPALRAWGARIDFWRVAMKPGKPLMVATRAEQVIFGLPGNPVSSFVTAFLFVLPFVKAMLGARDPIPCSVTARLSADLAATGARHEFLRGGWDGQSVTPVDNQDSSALQALAQANCLIDRPPHAPAVQAGEEVAIHLLGSGHLLEFGGIA